MTSEIAVTLKAAMAAKQAIAEHGAETGREPGPEAAGDGSLNDENIDRPDGRSHQHANADAGKHELKGGEDDLRARLQGPGPIRSSRTAPRPAPRGVSAISRSTCARPPICEIDRALMGSRMNRRRSFVMIALAALVAGAAALVYVHDEASTTNAGQERRNGDGGGRSGRSSAEGALRFQRAARSRQAHGRRGSRQRRKAAKSRRCGRCSNRTS